MTPRDAVRLADVAKHAGVTVSTASRALARPEMVRPETRERVEKAAAELGYEPNRAARSLITGRTGVIAIMVPDLANTYFAHIARAAQEFARARSYEVLIVDTGDDPQREIEIIDSAARWVDGLIICAARRGVPADRSRVPMVFVNRRVRGSHAVVLDQPFIVETQIGHLLELGHEHIVWVDGPKGYWATEPRRKVAQRIAARHPVQIVKDTPPTFEGGMELVDQLGSEVTAVATFNDRQAFGVIQRCLQLGIRVPDDLSVVGSDNVAGATFLIPSLTTVHAPKGTMGRAAVSLLLDHIVDKGPVIEETVTGHLVVRAVDGTPPDVREADVREAEIREAELWEEGVTMQHTRLGRTGLSVSRLCLGTMTFGLQSDEATSIAILDRAFDAGVTFLDTADVYPVGGDATSVGRTEEIIGRWLPGRRDDVIVATKCFGPMGPRPWDWGNSRKHVMDAIDSSLRRLGTDYIDLYQLHGPDPNTPIDETLHALDDLVRVGKVRYVGCSNFLAYQIARAVGRSEALDLVRFESVQPRYNLLFRQIERELLPLCAEARIGVIPYNPIAGGMLTGKHARGEPTQGTRFTLGSASRTYQDRYWHEGMFETVDALQGMARDAGLSLTTLAVAWVLSHPAITSPIIGASRPDQLDDTLAAADVELDPELKARLDELTTQYRMGDAAR